MDAKEPDIVISGTGLNEAQSMTVRVAVQQFAMLLDGPIGPGLGEPLRTNYLDRLREVSDLMSKTSR